MMYQVGSLMLTETQLISYLNNHPITAVAVVANPLAPEPGDADYIERNTSEI